MLTPYSSEDLGRVFDARTLTKGRTLILQGGVDVTLGDPSIAVAATDEAGRHTATITPLKFENRVAFSNSCSCGQRSCVHQAAGALAALERFPALRKAAQATFLDTLTSPAPPPPDTAPEHRRLEYELSPGELPAACFVSPFLVGERTGNREPTTPSRILTRRNGGESNRMLARLLGSGSRAGPIAVAPAAVTSVLSLLARIGTATWHANGRTLILGADRSFAANVPPDLPPQSAIVMGDGESGPWYVDAATGEVGRIRLAKPPAPPAPILPRRAIRQKPVRIDAAEPVILERPPTPVLHLRRMDVPDAAGRMQPTDTLSIGFDYDGVPVPFDDDRQFVRVPNPSDPAAPPSFVRRDRALEASALELLRPDGFTPMRLADSAGGKGRTIHLFRGRDAAERWQAFIAGRVPALLAIGWRQETDPAFGPDLVDVGIYDVRVADAEGGAFSLDFGVEVDGKRLPLLPILLRLLENGGIEAAQVVDGVLITSLEDGRVLKLPAERIRRLLAIMADLVDAAARTPGLGADGAPDGKIVLPESEAASVLDLEDIMPTQWDDASGVEAYAARFRATVEIPPVIVPKGFTATLRPYQLHGVAWLQHLRSQGMSGFLADDMGLGKTAQTIAHIAIEHAERRLDRPALIVVPTSLVANWSAELEKFAPNLRTLVLHGTDRHARRAELDGVHVVITTYTVLTRDIDDMAAIPWHLVVLDEAQVIKSPDSKATKAVSQLDSRFRLCLSGTPIENNLGELWSEFSFLMPGLLGDRRGFAKRYRTPIEKNGDVVRRVQLIRRIRPFLLRRTKGEVATDLPPKHTILRRIDLAPEQRELYETIRATLHDQVLQQLPGLSAARGRVVMLDALLKLRQVCCDPRLVKLPSARLVDASSKLEELLEMVTEMVEEGRRILLFSQFTSMLDLIKPRLDEAGIRFVELRGDTQDRGAPVNRFEAGEAPLFLISLKAGGRGLNLTSADTVIHYDPWWNPAVEDQASDRAHRIGQTKSIFVYKLVAADTVEDRILELQERKANLASIALGGPGTEPDLDGIEVEDLEFLFGDPRPKQPALSWAS